MAAFCRAQSPAGLLLPVATTYDSSGNLFFADARRHQVFELTLAGTWSVVAGTGEQGFTGDGGAPTLAMLNSPRGLAVAADGTLFIADTGNQRVRAVKGGVISTVAGSGVRGYTGEGPALQAAFRDPTALATAASGDVFICDTGNDRVRRLSSGTLSTLAGNGTQGFAGDGGAATAAELDTPLGVAVGADGRVLIADTHNQRIRQVAPDGSISTLAGNGAKGFAGDGADAASAALNLPSGVAFARDGSALIADSGNQRIRSVSVSGTIRTVAGTGVQGFSLDSSVATAAALNNPRSVTSQSFAPAVFADSNNTLVRELATDNALYTLALLSAPRTATVNITFSTPPTYGHAIANVSVASSASLPQGTVQLSESGTPIASAQLLTGASAVALGSLQAGTHSLVAAYLGDGLHGSATSGPVGISIAPAAVVASADALTLPYGSVLPVMTGSVMGILAWDTANVRATFASTAGPLSSPGTYPINATLIGQGSSNYALQMASNSGPLTISRAASITTLVAGTQTYAGLPLLLSANVISATSGTPTGALDFLDGGTVVASASLLNGGASASVLALSTGTHSYAARYSGDPNFLASSSPAANVIATAIPDFSVAFGSSTQSVQGGSVAVFALNITPQNGPFTGAVSFSVNGLPQGATATFSPVAVVPGGSGAGTNLSIQTVALHGFSRELRPVNLAIVSFFTASIVFLPFRRRRGARALMIVSLVAFLAPLGCGTRSTGTAADAGQAFTFTVRGTATNLAGAVVSHSATTTLTVF